MLLCSGVLAVVYALTQPVADPLNASHAPRPDQAVETPPYPAESLVLLVTRRDLFRVTRTPTGSPYNPLTGGSIPPPAASPKPSLTLVGIVAGYDPTALIEGFPGVDGARVVRVGDVVAGLRVWRITRTGVRVVGMDTSWVLHLRQPWR